MWRSRVIIAVTTVAVAVTAVVAGPASASRSAGPRVLTVGTYHGVRGQFATIQAAVSAARSGDWVLVAPGDYHENSGSTDHPSGVLITTGIHLRGMDRNGVVVDGTTPGPGGPCSSDPARQTKDRNGVLAYKASGVSIENLTACNFLTSSTGGNQIWFNGGDGSGQIGMHGYYGAYLTASTTYSNDNNKPRGEYGIFVSNADGPGLIEHTYASSMGDSAYYIGACRDCNTVLRDAHAQYSALGYSGTNSGGNLIIENSEFDLNKTGIVSNSQNNDDRPSPEIGSCVTGKGPLGTGSCTIWRHNYVHDNNNVNVPGAGSGLSGGAPVGTGIVLAGTTYVTLQGNLVTGNGAWGVLVTDLPDQETPPPGANCQGGTYIPPPASVCYFPAFGNYLLDNEFAGNGFYRNPTNGDIGLIAAPHNPGNCFNGNIDRQGLTTDPPFLQAQPYYPCNQPNAGDMGPLFAEAVCASEIFLDCPNLPLATYPKFQKVELPPIPREATMPNPCVNVPRNPWCPNNP